uniref:SCAN box domain-containing protein n=1 Tax=Oreochromis niloticus TaxID=8128 RepID=A0A669E575_ORENI
MWFGLFGSFLVVGVVGVCVIMEFSLDDFVTSPSWDKIVGCKKADLLIIASFYDVQVSYGARKAEVKDALCAGLVERGILSAPKAAVERPGGRGVKVAPETGPEPDAKGPVNVLPAGVESDAAEVDSDAAEAVSEAPESGTAGEPLAGRSTEDLRLTLRIREVETRAKELEVQAMHLRVRALELERKPSTSASSHPSTSTAVSTGFDITKHVKLVPPFREAEVDSYFNAFERIAAALSWPKEFWPLLLQCKLVGKAQEVCTSLSIEDSLDYDIMKKTVLQAYELVPEAYRQKFRKCEKTANQTFVEFAREKSRLFERWLQASKVKDFEGLKELLLLEEFKKCLPDQVVIYLNEQKVTSLAKAAVMADEFTLTHKTIFSAAVAHNIRVGQERKIKSPKVGWKDRQEDGGNRDCFYCREPRHLIAVCPALRRKEQRKGSKNPAGVGLIKVVPSPEMRSTRDLHHTDAEIEPRFKPFITKGFVSVTGEEKDKVPMTASLEAQPHHKPPSNLYSMC